MEVHTIAQITDVIDCLFVVPDGIEQFVEGGVDLAVERCAGVDQL
jgi:hypothetical protein